MNPTITTELQFFLISVLWGSIILFAYDCLRIFRRLLKHSSFFLAVEDVFFWIAASVFIFAMIYNENNGVIRGFCIMGMAVGTIIYHFIISDFVVNSAVKLIRVLLKPFTQVFKLIKELLHKLILVTKQMIKFIIRRLKKWMKWVRIALNTRIKKAPNKPKDLTSNHN